MQAFPDNFAAMTTVSPSDILNCLKIPKNLSKDDITTISPSDVLDCLKIPKNLSKDDITTITPSDVLGCLSFLRIFQRVILPPYVPCLWKFIREATKGGSYINLNLCVHIHCLHFIYRVNLYFRLQDQQFHTR